MASTIIHIAVAKELNKKLYKDEYQFLLGAIAPDICKIVGQTKVVSHFQNSLDNPIPNINIFFNKYKKQLNEPFILGYYIHLYTDKLWFDGFIDRLKSYNCIKLLDGTILTLSNDEITNLIYNDYTNLNIQLLDYYNIDLSLFYNEFIKPITNLNEIPIDKLNLLIDKSGVIIKNSKEKKSYIFDIYMITKFIDECVDKIYNEIIKIYINQ